MKGIKQIVSDFGFELGEKADEFEKAVMENYAARAELEEKNKRIETLTSQVEDLGSQIKSYEGTTEEVATLQAKVAEFEQAEAQRVQAAAEAEAMKAFDVLFTEAVGERKFANTMTRESVHQKAYTMHTENPAMDVSAIVDSITKDVDNVWENPQRPTAKVPVPKEDSKAELGEFARNLFRRDK